MSDLPERQQDAAFAGSYGSRPGAKDTTPAGFSSTPNSEAAPFVQSGSAATGSVADHAPGAHQVQGSVRNIVNSTNQQGSSTRGQVESTPLSGKPQVRAPPAERGEDLLPASGHSNNLSEREQDDTLAGSRPARPGVSSGEARHDVVPDSSSNLPVGVSSSSNPTSDGANQQEASPVASGAQTVYNQLSSAQAVQRTAQTGAQYAAASAQTGANALYQQAPSAETVQDNAQSAIVAAKNGTNSVYQQAPSTQQVRETTQSGVQSVQNGTLSAATTAQSGLLQFEEQAYQAAQSVLGSVQSGLAYVKEAVAGHQQAQENDRVHKDGINYIKEQLESKRTDTDKHTLLPVVGGQISASSHNGTAQPSAPSHGQAPPTYPRIGTAQVGQQRYQSESIPPVIVPKAGPEPGKGVTLIDDSAAQAQSSYPRVGAAQVGNRSNQTDTVPPATVPRDGPEVGKGVAPVVDSDRASAGQSKSGGVLGGDVKVADRFARAGSINPVETNAGEGLSAPPVLPDEDIDRV